MKTWLLPPKGRKSGESRFFLFLQAEASLRFYTISDDYISFLQKTDPSVANNGGENYKGRKLYIGVVLEIGGHKYFAPLSSYKPKQDKFDSSACSLFKIHERGNPNNKLGIISLNNMIPVPDSELITLDLSAQSESYRRMLFKQYEFIKTNRDEIIRRAKKLHDHVVVRRTDFFVKISCDFSALVDQCGKYNKPAV